MAEAPEQQVRDIVEDSNVYRDKYEHLKLLVQRQHAELQSVMLRNKCLETLLGCLEMERDDNCRLKENEKRLISAVNVLQCRLATNKLSISTQKEAQEGTLVPLNGAEKILALNLSCVDSMVTKDDQKVFQLSNELRAQKQISEELRNELTKLKNVRHLTDNAKTVEILRVKSQMAETSAQNEDQAILCQALAGCVENLKNRLTETVSKCQELTQSLNSCRKNSSYLQDEVSGKVLTGSTDMSALVLRLQKEHEKDTETCNAWKVYCEQQDEHIKRLRKELEEKKRQSVRQLSTSLSSSSLSPSPGVHSSLLPHATDEQHSENSVSAYKQKICAIECEKEKISGENCNLRAEICRLTARIKEHEEITARILGGTNSGELDMLKQQVINLKEDVRLRNKDREKLRLLMDELRNENCALKFQLEEHLPGLKQRNDYRDGRSDVLDGRSISSVADADCGPIAFQPLLPNDSKAHEFKTFQRKASNTLCCPTCRKEFPTDRHIELIEHMDQCCG